MPIVGLGLGDANASRELNQVRLQLPAAGSPLLQLAESDCGVSQDGKPALGRRPPAPPRPNCPVNPATVGGAQERPTGDIVPDTRILYTESNLASPLYQTLEGQFFGDSRLEWSWSSAKLYNAQDTQIGTRDANSFAIQQFIRYGVTDNLSLAAHVEYDPASSVTTLPVNGVPVTRHNPGWSNPEFDVYYRVLSQPDDPVYLDVGPQYGPGWTSPNEHFEFQERVGYAAPDWAIDFGELTTYNWSDDPKAKDVAAYWQVRMGLETFYTLSHRWSVNANVAYFISPGHDGDGATQFHGQVNYDLVPDKLQVSLEYEYRIFGESARNRDRTGNFAGIRLGYLFDLYDPTR